MTTRILLFMTTFISVLFSQEMKSIQGKIIIYDLILLKESDKRQIALLWSIKPSFPLKAPDKIIGFCMFTDTAPKNESNKYPTLGTIVIDSLFGEGNSFQ